MNSGMRPPQKWERCMPGWPHSIAPKLKELLSPDQLKRLRQIQIQAAGIDALLEAETAADLQLSEEQKTSLTAPAR